MHVEHYPLQVCLYIHLRISQLMHNIYSMKFHHKLRLGHLNLIHMALNIQIERQIWLIDLICWHDFFHIIRGKTKYRQLWIYLSTSSNAQKWQFRILCVPLTSAVTKHFLLLSPQNMQDYDIQNVGLKTCLLGTSNSMVTMIDFPCYKLKWYGSQFNGQSRILGKQGVTSLLIIHISLCGPL